MRPLKKVPALIVLVAAVALLTPVVTSSAASTTPGQITTLATVGVTSGFDAGSTPRHTVTGPDGLVWFTDFDSVNRINGDGTVSRFDAVPTFGADPSLTSIVVGPDGNLWFAKFNPPGQVGKITTAGVMTKVTSFTSGNVEDVIVGPDQNLWFTKPFDDGGGVIGRLTTAGVSTVYSPPNDTPQPRSMTVGSDGNIWYTDDGGPSEARVGSILKSTTAGVITVVAQSGVTDGFDAGFLPYPITLGPDGNVWAAMVSSGPGAVARVTPAGVVTQFTAAGVADLTDITSGCGALWVSQQAEEGSDPAIWRLTTAGVFTEYTAGLPATTSPQGLSLGTDDDLKIAATGDPSAILDMTTGCVPEPPTTTTTAPAAAAQAVAATPAFTG